MNVEYGNTHDEVERWIGDRPQLEGKRILVTGGNGGIGRSACIRFAEQGAAVAILDLVGETSTSDVINQFGGSARFFPVDVADESVVRDAVGEAAKWLGGIDTLVHCAGIMRGQGVPVTQLEAELWTDVLSINLTGTFHVVKHVVPHILADGGGVIALLASVGGVVRESGSFAYAASKGGIHGFAITLDAQLERQGIRVHTVCPGGVDTALFHGSVEEGRLHGYKVDFDPQGLTPPARLADVLAFLVSDAGAQLPHTLVLESRA